MSGVKVWTGAEWKVATPENFKIWSSAYGPMFASWVPWRPTVRTTFAWTFPADASDWQAGLGSSLTVDGDAVYCDTGAGILAQASVGGSSSSIQGVTPIGTYRWTCEYRLLQTQGGIPQASMFIGINNQEPAAPFATHGAGDTGWLTATSDTMAVTGPFQYVPMRLWADASAFGGTAAYRLWMRNPRIIDEATGQTAVRVDPGNLRAWDGIRWVAP